MILREMAENYRRSAELLRLRITALKEAMRTAESPAERGSLERRIRDLESLYRDTREIALVLERYYDRRYRKNGRYTL